MVSRDEWPDYLRYPELPYPLKGRTHLDLFDEVADWQAPVELPDLREGLVSLDLETRDDGLDEGAGPGWAWGGGYVVGAALAWGGGSGYYPVAHEAGGNLPEAQVLQWLLDLLARPNLTWCFANAQYDLGWMRRWAQQAGKEFKAPAGKIIDVQVMAPLIDEYRPSYSLDSLGKDFAGRGKDEDFMKKAASRYGFDPKQVKNILWKLPSSAVGAYATGDAALTLDLVAPLRSMINKQSLGMPATIEHGIIPVLIDMRWQGIKVNVETAARLERDYAERVSKSLGEIKRKTGIRPDIWSVESLAKAFIEEGVDVPRTAAGNYSIVQRWLKRQSELGSVVAEHTLAARKYDHAMNTFVKGHILGNARRTGSNEWRIFPEFYSVRSESEDGARFGTVSYRFSSSKPFLQNLPGRDGELTSDIRGMCEPEDGAEWLSADYSQQEPKMAIHFAAIAQEQGSQYIRGAIEAREAIRTDPTWDFHSFASKVTGIPRKKVKTISLGRMYGAGAGTIADQMDLPFTIEKGFRGGERKVGGPEAVAIVEEYDAGMPWVKGAADHFQDEAKRNGIVRLLGNYAARFNEHGGRKGDFPNKAFNRKVQGSSAIQTKVAMIAAHAAGVRLNLTMHDELGASGHKDKEGKILVECMLDSFKDKLTLPMKVDLASGRTWGEAALAE